MNTSLSETSLMEYALSAEDLHIGIQTIDTHDRCVPALGAGTTCMVTNSNAKLGSEHSLDPTIKIRKLGNIGQHDHAAPILDRSSQLVDSGVPQLFGHTR
jgi:hypothetical protein